MDTFECLWMRFLILSFVLSLRVWLQNHELFSFSFRSQLLIYVANSLRMGGRMSTELLPRVCAEIRINSFVLWLHAQIDILNKEGNNVMKITTILIDRYIWMFIWIRFSIEKVLMSGHTVKVIEL